MRKPQIWIQLNALGLNPCCIGTCSMRVPRTYVSRLQLYSLNPCCIGTCSMSPQIHTISVNIVDVLILVVLEHAQ